PHPAVGHDVAAHGRLCERMWGQRQAVLGLEGKAGSGYELEIGSRARTSVDGDEARLQTVFRAAVAAGGIADDFDIKLGLDSLTKHRLRRPGPRNAEQAVLQQQ